MVKPINKELLDAIKVSSYAPDRLLRRTSGTSIWVTRKNASVALQDALTYEDAHTYVATLPELMQHKIEHPRDPAWSEYIDSRTEEVLFTDSKGLFGRKDNKYVAIIHGEGYVTSGAMNSKIWCGLEVDVASLNAFLTTQMVPNGNILPRYFVADLEELPDERNFYVILPMSNAYFEKTLNPAEIINHPHLIARAGSRKLLTEYVERAKSSANLMSSEPYNAIRIADDEANEVAAQARKLRLEPTEGGIYHATNFNVTTRYAVISWRES